MARIPDQTPNLEAGLFLQTHTTTFVLKFWEAGFHLSEVPPPSPPPLPYLLVGASPINGGCNEKPSKKITTLTAITPTIITFASQTARDHGHSQYKINELCQGVLKLMLLGAGGWVIN